MPSATHTYVIGDIHGCYEELLELEEKIAAHAAARDAKPFIVTVGDLIDRGPDSQSVVRHFREGSARGTHVAVAGNHEANYLEILTAQFPERFAAAGGRSPFPVFVDPDSPIYLSPARFPVQDQQGVADEALSSWLYQGGLQTLASINAEPDRCSSWFFPEADFDYLCSLPLVWRNDKLVVTHALARRATIEYALRFQEDQEQKGDARQHSSALRNIMWSRDRPVEAPDERRAHLSGHTPLMQPAYYEDVNCRMIDTGCVYGIQLTAWCADTQDYLSVASRQPRLRK